MYRYYEIAGLKVKMDTFGRTEDFALPYQINDCNMEDISISTDNKLFMKHYPDLNEDACEYIESGIDFYRKLIDYNGLMLHASAVCLDDKAYLFTADCGTGKSTHTKLWRKVFGDEQVRVINDDKPALRFEDGTWYAYGTPWSGKYGVNLNLKYPVAGICFLKQSPENKIKLYDKDDIVYQIMRQTSRPNDTEKKIKLLSNIDCLLNNIPVWMLECNMEQEAALLSYKVMTENYER